MFLRGIFLTACGSFAIACSPATNINKYLVSKDQESALDVLLSRAEIAYDHKDYDGALDLAEEAAKISPGNEAAAVLLGYIHLSLGGIDSFSLASGLLEAGSTKSTSLLAASKGASETLAKLRPVVGITDEDILKMGDLSEAGADQELFEGEDVILPYSMTEARAADINVLNHVNKAISYVCPFVDEVAKLADSDIRHSAENCPPSENPRKSRPKSHFVWAFAHLTEALAFHSVVLFQESTKTQPNIQSRVDNLSAGQDEISVVSYVNHVVGLSEAVTEIFAVEDEDAQIYGVLNDLITVSKAFAVLAGLPIKIKRSIDKAITSIEEKTKAVTTGSDDAKAASGLKGELTKNLAKGLSEQIDALADGDTPPSEEELADLCDAYEEIAAGTTEPDSCAD